MSLREELLAIDGVIDAQVDDAARPGGVKVRLDTGANADTVGSMVQEVLASHGLRSRVGPRHVEPEAPPPPPGAPASVVSLPSRGMVAGSVPVSLESVADAALEAVSVSEHSSGRLVTATAVDGRTASRPAGDGDDGLAVAVVTAVADLAAAGAAPPRLVGVEDLEVDGTAVVVVVLAVASGMQAGAAVVAGARSRALGLAAWNALA
ncbi:MAG: hypothetical protein KJN71_01900 [Acidimicrobiia bacterium]|nr:hypothetical protein [Acidimicrobiia bacterium]NNC74990.1 hypothetical protein [Acidimicrobiia bacterium]